MPKIETAWKTLDDWHDIGAEDCRVYVFPFEKPDKSVVLVRYRIDDPKLLWITPGTQVGGDSNRIIAADRSVYVPRGWIAAEAPGARSARHNDPNDISHEIYRTYLFPYMRRDGVVILIGYKIDSPKLLWVIKTNGVGGDNHVVTTASKSVHIPPGWVGLEWRNECEDQYCF